MRYTCLPPSDNKNKSPSLLELLDVLCSRGSADCFEPSFVSDHIVRVVNSASRRRLGKLDTYTVLEYLCSKNVPPVSVLTALIFIEKLVVSNPDSPLLTEVTAFDLFAVSVVVASKYLHDDDTDYGMYNADWASEFDMDLKELNELEVKFILALNWEFFVTKAQILRFGFEIGVFNRPAKSTSAGDKLEFRFPALSCLVRNLSSHKIRAVSKIVFVLAVAYMSMNNYSDCSLSINCRIQIKQGFHQKLQIIT
uniref:Protein CNPPD1 n=1 Tax=Trichobilharzia regenti TaxID=157069 RepID=A0AA85K1T4_TRIRE|nr:unnamed protein product [Trichobilharzia regenti]